MERMKCARKFCVLVRAMLMGDAVELILRDGTKEGYVVRVHPSRGVQIWDGRRDMIDFMADRGNSRIPLAHVRSISIVAR